MQKLSNGRRVCDRYVLLERIGTGGHGEIWRVYDDRDGREVALKILHPGIADSPEAWMVLQREFEMVQRLAHPGILHTEAPVRSGDFAALPMEFAGAGDLRRLRGQSYLRIVPVLVRIAEVLEHAHGRGVVHRDLKPGNVLFDARGGVRLADFGAAGLTGHTDMLTTGSPFSASPQQLRGEPASPADDVYGLGALSYELLSGYPPFYPDFDRDKVLNEPVGALQPVHPAPLRLIELVMAMLAKNPRQRPSSMQHVIDALNASLADPLGAAEESSQTLLLPEPATLGELPGVNYTAELPVLGLAGDATLETPVHAVAYGAGAGVGAGAGAAGRSARVTVNVAPASAQARERVAARMKLRGAARSAPGAEPRLEPRLEPQLEPQLDARDEPVPQYVPPRVEPEPGIVSSAVPIEAARIVYGALPPRPARRRAPRTGWVPWLAGAAIVAVLIAAVPSLSRWRDARSLPQSPPAVVPVAADTAPPTTALVVDPTEALTAARGDYAAALAALEKRQAGAWAGKAFAAAKASGETAERGADAGALEQATQQYRSATQALQAVVASAPAALQRELGAGRDSLAQGRALLARQHFERANRIEAGNADAQRGLAAAAALDQALDRIAEGARAEETAQLPRALALYDEALKLAPGFVPAQEARDRVASSVGDTSHSRAVSEGLAAMGGGKLDAARSAFERAQQVRPASPVARDGIARVDQALAAEDFAAQRRTAADLEEAERWKDAMEDYQQALDRDATLAFARTGLARAKARYDLGSHLDALISRPERLGSDAVYADAINTLQHAHEVTAPGPVLRSQVDRLQLLLEDFNRPVAVALESDNSTVISIARVGAFGSFRRREVTLRPGSYTVIGTRAGFRDVRRDIMLQPGQRGTVVSVQCTDPI